MPGNSLEKLDATDILSFLSVVASASFDELSKTIRLLASEMNEDNELIAVASLFLAEMHHFKEQNKKAMSGECRLFFKNNDIPVSVNDFEANISNLQDFIDGIVSLSQMDLIELQSLSKKQDERTKMFSGLLSQLQAPNIR